MILSADVRYRCQGCGHKMCVAEHARNLTQEKIMVSGFESTMTVILCDTCKPKYDEIVRTQRKDTYAEDMYEVLENVQQIGGEHDGATG